MDHATAVLETKPIHAVVNPDRSHSWTSYSPSTGVCECYQRLSYEKNRVSYLGLLAVAIVLVVFAALTSGLTLGVSSLNMTWLNIMSTTGSEKRRFIPFHIVKYEFELNIIQDARRSVSHELNGGQAGFFVSVLHFLDSLKPPKLITISRCHDLDVGHLHGDSANRCPISFRNRLDTCCHLCHHHYDFCRSSPAISYTTTSSTLGLLLLAIHMGLHVADGHYKLAAVMGLGQSESLKRGRGDVYK